MHFVEPGGDVIIPQQKTLGSYNCHCRTLTATLIILQQKTLGSYNFAKNLQKWIKIIPQQETSGSYNQQKVPRYYNVVTQNTSYSFTIPQHPHKSYNEKSPSSCC